MITTTVKKCKVHLNNDDTYNSMMTEKLINKILDTSPATASINQRKSQTNLRSPALITSDRTRNAKSCLRFTTNDQGSQQQNSLANYKHSNLSQRCLRLFQEGEIQRQRKEQTIKNVQKQMIEQELQECTFSPMIQTQRRNTNN